MSLLGYFWFGETTKEEWIVQNAAEGVTAVAAYKFLKKPKNVWMVASYAGRLGWNAGRAVATTSIVKGVSMAHVATGYAAGALCGTLISYSVWGEEGASHAIDFYSDPLDGSKWSKIGKGLATLIP